MQRNFYAPRPAYDFGEPFIGGAALVRNACAACDHVLNRIKWRAPRWLFFFGIQPQRHRQTAFVTRAEKCQRTMRRNRFPCFGIRKIIGEFCTLVFLARDHFRFDHAMRDQIITHTANQASLLRETLHQNLFRTFECGFDIRHDSIFFIQLRRFCAQIFLRFGFGCQHRIRQQIVREWLQACFFGNLRFGAALRFIRQIQIFQRGFILCGFHTLFQFRRELTLLFN